MLPPTLSALGLGLLATAASAQAQSSSPCPFNYPSEVNTTTSSNGLVFTIASNSAVTNNRAVQLRVNPNLEGGFYAGIDARSEVLLANFREKGWYAQARDLSNQLYDLGPTGYLNLRDETPTTGAPGSGQNGTTSRYTVGFANATDWPGHVERKWAPFAPNTEGVYGLYHDEPVGVSHGFTLCEADHSLEQGPWYQLFYQVNEGSGELPDWPECESVGVRVAIGAGILNGECEIAGYTA